MIKIRTAIGLGLAALLVASPGHAQKRKDKSVYSAPDSSGQVRGVGVESQDIVSMSDQMMRDLLTLPQLMNAATPPRVIIDSKAFRNESSEIIDKALITDRIRVSLSRAAGGRVRFVGREYADASQMERDLKDSGAVILEEPPQLPQGCSMIAPWPILRSLSSSAASAEPLTIGMSSPGKS